MFGKTTHRLSSVIRVIVSSSLIMGLLLTDLTKGSPRLHQMRLGLSLI
nr:MAG TPA: hypothetical protein [Caudoviricetes sp.]